MKGVLPSAIEDSVYPYRFNSDFSTLSVFSPLPTHSDKVININKMATPLNVIYILWKDIRFAT